MGAGVFKLHSRQPTMPCEKRTNNLMTCEKIWYRLQSVYFRKYFSAE